jgi:hypothetical protein
VVSEEDPRSAVRWDFEKWQQHWDISDVVEVESGIATKESELARATADADYEKVAQIAFELSALKKQLTTKTSDYDWCRKVLEGDEFEGSPEGAQRAMDAVREIIVSKKDQIIPFRRRKFENDAMLVEIFRRCKLWTATVDHAAVDGTSSTILARHASQHFTHDVAVIHSSTGEAMKATLCGALEANGLEVADGVAAGGLEAAVWVLVIISEGTATESAAAVAIARALELGRALVGVMDIGPRAGSEASAAAAATALAGGPDIGSLFANHELLTYRELDFERDALVAEMTRRFTVKDE